ncbi:hypothetical protein CCP2SC5_190003 [Azospirillaceae bacterium]
MGVDPMSHASSASPAERAYLLTQAENIAKHHYLDVASRYAKDFMGGTGPYDHPTNLTEVEEARKTYEELKEARLLAENSEH